MCPEFRVYSSSDGYAWLCPFCEEKVVVKFKGEIPDDPAIAVKPIFDHVIKSHPEELIALNKGVGLLEKNIQNIPTLDAKVLRMVISMWKETCGSQYSPEYAKFERFKGQI